MSEVDITIDNAINFKTFEDIPGKIDVTITANHIGPYWDTNSIKRATWKEATDIIHKVFPLDNTINGIIVLSQISTTDACGNKTEDMITTIDISRDVFNKIDFDNFNYENIPVIADQYIRNKNIK